MKPKILSINSVCGFGSTGRIVADLSKLDNFETLVCFGRKKDYANVNSYRFANFFDNAIGALGTILFDNNLNICSNATKRLIKKIKEFNPDIIHIHNIHGYYLNVEEFVRFLKEYGKPVVWTLHDCWLFTGYCPFFDYIECEKYKTECKDCPYGFSYPFSIFKQNVKKDYYKKKELFKDFYNLVLVSPSKWMDGIVENSYFNNIKHVVINNGISLQEFIPSKQKDNDFTVLAVSNYWTKAKGIDELNKIIPLLDKDIKIKAIGFGSKNINNAISIERTNNKQELIDLYSSSHVLVSPTLQDNFPTVNIESLACGTPVVTYKTGGGPEIIDENTGIVVKRHEYKKMAEVINNLKQNYTFDTSKCIDRSKQFSLEKMKENYIKLYESLLAK